MTENAVSIRYRLKSSDFTESEAGMAHHLGLGPPVSSTPSRLGAALVGLVSAIAPTRATINDAGIQIAGGELHPWSEIGDTYETDNLVCMVLASTTAPIVLPKRAMTESDLAALRRFATRVPHDHDPIVAARTGRI